MAGFGNSTNEEKPSGIYAQLVDNYVRVLFGGNGVIVGRLSFTDHVKTHLQPYIVPTGTDLLDEARIVEDKPATIRTDSITAVIPLGVDKEYLERIVEDATESNRIKRFLREKDLKRKGYFEDRK